MGLMILLNKRKVLKTDLTIFIKLEFFFILVTASFLYHFNMYIELVALNA